MTWLEKNFYSMFKIFWRDTTYRTNKLNHTVHDFIIDKWGEDGRTVNFTLVFEEPYKLGLLVKKSDKLYIEVKEGYEGEKIHPLFLPNEEGLKNTTRLITKTDWKRIEMIFDFENPVMMTMRKISANMYWVMIGIVFVQFVLLVWRGVGLLTVWVLIEYMQLVAFMPIYNFRLIPYLYDAFKPCLVFHMIIFDETPLMPELDREFFNQNYEYYWLSVGRLF